jgi:hypothetical protein
MFRLKASILVSMVIFLGLTRNQLALCKIFSSARTNVVSVHVISGLMRVDKDGGRGGDGWEKADGALLRVFTVEETHAASLPSSICLQEIH